MMHPHTILKPVDNAVGLGVFATRPIPRGPLTWVRDPLDQVLPDAQVRALDPMRRRVVEKYAWREEDDWILCWDHGRYVNHSCEANCLGIGVDYEVALRDIAEGEQLTDDYRSLGPFEGSFRCRCGAPSCQARVYSDNLPEGLVEHWQRAFTLAMADYELVAQPLEGLLPRASRATPIPPDRALAPRMRL
jgi:hypothetical protein